MIRRISISAKSILPKLDIYFTLGQHKGVDPCGRRIIDAINFAKALENIFLLNTSNTNGDDVPPISNWKVIVTGTDATLPSSKTHKKIVKVVADEDGDDFYDSSNVEIGSNSNILTVPCYHIMEYNYT